MAERRIHFDPTINLGHLISAGVFLVTAGIGWATMNARVEALEREDARQEKSVVSAETRLTTRINEERARLDQTSVRIADDIREIKTLMRDGFRDLDQKLDRKMDKPGR